MKDSNLDCRVNDSMPPIAIVEQTFRTIPPPDDVSQVFTYSSDYSPFHLLSLLFGCRFDFESWCLIASLDVLVPRDRFRRWNRRGDFPPSCSFLAGHQSNCVCQVRAAINLGGSSVGFHALGRWWVNLNLIHQR